MFTRWYKTGETVSPYKYGYTLMTENIILLMSYNPYPNVCKQSAVSTLHGSL